MKQPLSQPLGEEWPTGGWGLAGFLFSFGLVHALRGRGIITDEDAVELFDGAMLVLEQAGLGSAERQAAHEVLEKLLNHGAAVAGSPIHSPFEVIV